MERSGRVRWRVLLMKVVIRGQQVGTELLSVHVRVLLTVAAAAAAVHGCRRLESSVRMRMESSGRLQLLLEKLLLLLVVAVHDCGRDRVRLNLMSVGPFGRALNG